MIRMGSAYQERYIATQRGTNDMRRVRRAPPQTGHPNQLWDFWAWASGSDKITIAEGEVQFGAHAAVAVAQTELTVSNDGELLGWKYTIATHTLEIINFTTTITPNATTLQKPLVRASLVGGAAGIARYMYFSPVVTTYYAGTTP